MRLTRQRRSASLGRRYTGGVATRAATESPARQAGREDDDVTLAQQVEIEILRPAGAPRGVNARESVVELRPAHAPRGRQASRRGRGIATAQRLGLPLECSAQAATGAVRDG